jgi:hypothetical protein
MQSCNNAPGRAHLDGFSGKRARPDELSGLMKGTQFRPMIVSGEPAMSNPVVLIAGRGEIRIPYGHKPLPRRLRREIWSWNFRRRQGQLTEPLWRRAR